MKYCFDASALIGLGERHYPERLKVFAPIWNHVYRCIESGDIISVDYVKIELERKADEWRDQFLARANKMFLISSNIEMEYATVISEIESNEKFSINNHRERFMSGADPWVIALARNIEECTVVSEEKKGLADYGLGPVCDVLGVKHMDLVQFFEANNIGM